MISPPLKLCIFGAGPGTGNLGVEALGVSLVDAITRRIENPELTVFDNGVGMREVGRGSDMPHRLCGISPTRRLYRPESLYRLAWCARAGVTWPAALQAVKDADAVLDVTSGDSFTDLYSRRRFHLVRLEKQIAIDLRRPLILAPQTIGPFRERRTADRARGILAASSMVWARDEQSFTLLRALLKNEFDPVRHRCGVDLAFSLPAARPVTPLPETVQTLIAAEDRPPLFGINVSGLIFNRPAVARDRYGIAADYREIVQTLIRRLLRASDAHILLVPHVMTRPGHYEHDPDAHCAVLEALGPAVADRVHLLPDGRSASETKWVISRTDWFCGTRMHAAIAALSSGVPTAAMAYSDKCRGVFACCGQDGHVADLRRQRTSEVIAQLEESCQQRETARWRLRSALPDVLHRAESQMDVIVSHCRKLAGRTESLRKAA